MYLHKNAFPRFQSLMSNMYILDPAISTNVMRSGEKHDRGKVSEKAVNKALRK